MGIDDKKTAWSSVSSTLTSRKVGLQKVTEGYCGAVAGIEKMQATNSSPLVKTLFFLNWKYVILGS